MRHADFRTGQQEDFRGQAVGPAVDGLAVAGAGAVGKFDLLDLRLDVGVEQGEELIVQVCVDGAGGVVVDVGAVPLAVFVDVLHQQPHAVTARVVGGAGLSLVNDDEVSRRAADFQLDGRADGLCA